MKMFKIAGVMMVSASIAVGCSAGTDPAADEAKPETTDTVSEALQIGTTTDQCSSSNFKVLNQSNQYQSIPHDGLWHYVNVAGRTFSWLCGGSNESTTCDVGTSYVYVRHLIGSREINWSCQQ
jgi:hypothetical protein